ncbi:hypothetical protein [Achromobacter sp. DMS1]|uniref:hypothetical protein n=1 Tax=Achromobacter sp. DMS1 TaxID=1688405 RepID=UPI001F2E1DA2|nr:hypothetical protein [Achromobacter sp. DMS1]
MKPALFRLACAAALAFALGQAPAQAAYPDHPVTLVFPPPLAAATMRWLAWWARKWASCWARPSSWSTSPARRAPSRPTTWPAPSPTATR